MRKLNTAALKRKKRFEPEHTWIIVIRVCGLTPSYVCDFGRMLFSNQKINIHAHGHGREDVRGERRAWLACSVLQCTLFREELEYHLDTDIPNYGKRYKANPDSRCEPHLRLVCGLCFTNPVTRPSPPPPPGRVAAL